MKMTMTMEYPYVLIYKGEKNSVQYILRTL